MIHDELCFLVENDFIEFHESVTESGNDMSWPRQTMLFFFLDTHLDIAIAFMESLTLSDNRENIREIYISIRRGQREERERLCFVDLDSFSFPPLLS